jgi:hypothetical protein
MLVAALFVMTTASAASAQVAEKAAPAVEVTKAVVATGVMEREPIGAAESFPADVGTVYFYTIFEGDFAEVDLHHVWLRDGEEMARIPLRARGPRWRTWSSKQIPPEWSGKWTVQVVAGDDQVLKAVEFRVGGAEGHLDD